MSLKAIFTVLVFLLAGALVTGVNAQDSRLQGAYGFVSETTVLVKPSPLTTVRKDPDWRGLFVFAGHYFSVSMIDGSRSVDWLTEFPKNIRDVGYESYAGRFEFKDSKLILRPDMGLHPFFDRRGANFDVRIDDRTVTLVQKLIPYTENLTEGSRTLVLSRQ